MRLSLIIYAMLTDVNPHYLYLYYAAGFNGSGPRLNHWNSVHCGLDPGHIVLDRNLAHPKGHSALQFSVHAYCGRTVAHLSYLLQTVAQKFKRHKKAFMQCG